MPSPVRLRHHDLELRLRTVMPLGLSLLLACTPSMNWREVRPVGAGVSIALPCTPSTFARELRLQGATTQWNIIVCSAGGQTWALASGELNDPALVAPALQSLAAAAKANVSADVTESLPWGPHGATPSANAMRVRMSGTLPDGRPVTQVLAVFARGTRVFQASVLGGDAAPEDLDTFFASVRVL